MSPLHLSSERLAPPRPRSWRKLLRRLEALAERWGRRPPRLDIHARGACGEDLAYWCLREQGYTIVARNYRLSGREGEIDLIAVEGDPSTLVFVEVKTRTRAGQFTAEDAVDAAKRSHLIRLARAYRRRRHYQGPFRFDVVAIYGPEEQHPEIRLHRGAFS